MWLPLWVEHRVEPDMHTALINMLPIDEENDVFIPLPLQKLITLLLYTQTKQLILTL